MRRVALTGVALGLLAAMGGCAGAETANDPEPTGRQGDVQILEGAVSDGSPNPTTGRSGPLPDAGAASCVESYAPEALRARAFAFDGVVVDVGRSVSDRGGSSDLGLPGVTFEVREWFSGGRADTVTVDLQPPTTGSGDPADPGYAYGVGSRLLVSGEARWGGSPLEAPIAWGCGFTRYHDPGTATAWRGALAP